MPKLYAQRSHFLGAGFATSMLLLVAGAALADVDIATSPLIVAEPLPPNIFFLLDDSGSMDRDDLPDTINCSGDLGGDLAVIHSDTGKLKPVYPRSSCQSPDFNKIYYNPAFTYTVPVNADGISLGDSTYTAARRDGYNASSSTTNLSLWTTRGNFDCASPNCEFHWYRYDGSGSTTSDSNYVRVSPTTQSERQNIANWYSYYRTRLYTARAGTSLAFDGIPDHYRVGYGSINYPCSSSYSTVISGVRPYSSLRSSFYSWLFSATPATSTYYYTPLRRALNNVGLYYESAEPWRLDPADSASLEYSCRACFTILMTDGYWTGDTTYQATTTGARANNDGTGGSTITGPNSQSYAYTATSTFSDTIQTPWRTWPCITGSGICAPA